MTIQLTVEDENLIQKRLQSGVFRSVEEVIHDTLRRRTPKREWLAENKEAINEKIARGIAQLDRGEGVSGEAGKSAAPAAARADWSRDRRRVRRAVDERLHPIA